MEVESKNHFSLFHSRCVGLYFSFHFFTLRPADAFSHSSQFFGFILLVQNHFKRVTNVSLTIRIDASLLSLLTDKDDNVDDGDYARRIYKIIITYSVHTVCSFAGKFLFCCSICALLSLICTIFSFAIRGILSLAFEMFFFCFFFPPNMNQNMTFNTEQSNRIKRIELKMNSEQNVKYRDGTVQSFVYSLWTFSKKREKKKIWNCRFRFSLFPSFFFFIFAYFEELNFLLQFNWIFYRNGNFFLILSHLTKGKNKK